MGIGSGGGRQWGGGQLLFSRGRSSLGRRSSGGSLWKRTVSRFHISARCQVNTGAHQNTNHTNASLATQYFISHFINHEIIFTISLCEGLFCFTAFPPSWAAVCCFRTFLVAQLDGDSICRASRWSIPFSEGRGAESSPAGQECPSKQING